MSQCAFVFPGQGSQTVGMLAELATQYPVIQQTFDEASQGVNVDLWQVSQQGPEERLNQTEMTQPALLAASVALWRLWQQKKIKRPDYFAGHSLGEYSALVCAGTLSLTEATQLVQTRGRLMQSAVPLGMGAMAAILGADDQLVIDVCQQVSKGEVVAPANFNSPGQIVISGHATAVERALVELGLRGVRKAIRLPVSVPSHCDLMRDAAEQLRTRILTLSWQMPVIPVIQNADAKSHDTIQAIQDALVRQLFQPVRWVACISMLQHLGVTCIVECGPGRVLTGLMKRIDKNIAAQSLENPEDFLNA